jgi:alkyl hydroperoxide reductase subunit AhpC
VLKQFAEKDAQLVGLSCDPGPSLKVWAQSLGGIGYPLLSDFHPHGRVSQSLGLFNGDNGFTLRAIVIADKSGNVRSFKPSPAGTIPDPADVLKELSGLQG